MWNVIFALYFLLAGPGPDCFVRHDIASYAAGYQVAVADINGDSRPDVVALSTQQDRVDWFRNPDWQVHPVARAPRNIDLAIHDVDRDGRPEIALASGFYFDQSDRGGEIQLLFPPENGQELWGVVPIAVDPVVHRLRWADLDGDGTRELLHAPIFGPGSDGASAPRPAHLQAFRIQGGKERPVSKPWDIDRTLTVLHGIYVSDLDHDGRDEILTASFEGIHRLDYEQEGGGHWSKTHVSPGYVPGKIAPGTARGSSEIAAGRHSGEVSFLAAIEPWHGNQLVSYRKEGDRWRRRVLDDGLVEGHALVTADFDGDGMDEIVAGWRGGEGGLALYDLPVSGEFRRVMIDSGIKAEGIAVADINRDDKADLVVIGGRSNDLAWYENRTP